MTDPQNRPRPLPYHSPKLTELGTLAELTASGGFGSNDNVIAGDRFLAPPGSPGDAPPR
ncbi:MAG: lasso RiPP family leader peptide-containing protein [Chromatiales bacterium]|nr:lasso RiPP family leader peptide-containing protein [Chromatiales bacterium]